jgi:diguanylate cyclase (GGDEF)-like protein/PAS domain S-box-containing protein
MKNRILLLTNQTPDANTLIGVLGGTGDGDGARDGPFEVEWLTDLAGAQERLKSSGIDAIVLDLNLPDSQGLATLEQLLASAAHIPMMIICEDSEHSLTMAALEMGAQGYLSRSHFNSYLVAQGLRSIIARKAVEEVLYKEKARAEIALNSIGDAVICTNMAGRIDYLNIAAEKLTGWSREEADGLPLSEVFNIINAETRQPVHDRVESVLRQNKCIGLPADTLLIRHDGAEVPIEDSAAPINNWNGQPSGVVIVFHDVTAAQTAARRMAYLAQHDYLTGLPNRVLLNDRIEQAISLARRNNSQLALLFLDLDNFKHINDSLGHGLGDLLLQSVTASLVACVRGSDTVSRQGGDEFVILLADGKCENDAVLIANKILQALALPHFLGKHELFVTTSIGISLYPDDGLTADALIKSADTAMYHAKEKGRNNYQFFKHDMNIRAVERQQIEVNLRTALEKHEFLLHYQPKVNLITGKITGFEALLRWMHRDFGMILPERFMPIAEDCGLIVPIGRWVLREACSQAKRWHDAGLRPISISVNISALEFRQMHFLEGVHRILQDTGLDPHCLELEITESVLMRDAEASGTILRKLKKMGVRLAVDDFGTGYSSLAYLEQFPIDVLKIDQSFVHDIVSNPADGIIVGAVIGMGNSLKLRVVAEGIENQAQLSFLRSHHCDEGQGYLFSRPVSAEQFSHLLGNKPYRVVGN